jgi:hypothetical protein
VAWPPAVCCSIVHGCRRPAHAPARTSGRPPAGLALVRCLALAALLVAPAAARAQGAGVSPAMRAQLLPLSGKGCEVRYAPGALDRAAHVQEWLCDLAAGAGRVTPRGSAGTAVTALVLGRDEWQRAGLACPYGAPCPLEPGAVALPASGDQQTVALWTGALGRLPALGGTPLLGTSDEAASLAPADALALPILARHQVVAAGFAADEEWLLDLVGHLLVLDALRASEHGVALAAFWQGVRQDDTMPAGQVEGELQAEMRRQARLHAAAQALAGGDSRLPAMKLRKLQKRGGGRLRLADLQAEWPHAFHSVP